ncbi:hypothetical protein [Dysgonomonas sp. 520]|uniref:hypothetical protein n=1 Tax=Dysgonomonas sp. 520 TaxID=2302931 RepID=UPI0013D6F694|nr:hypothetical protein [Dysgonomonas sp. 520]NDW08489.1 hypothetical protein [Dysgonomonas sp. 520]
MRVLFLISKIGFIIMCVSVVYVAVCLIKHGAENLPQDIIIIFSAEVIGTTAFCLVSIELDERASRRRIKKNQHKLYLQLYTYLIASMLILQNSEEIIKNKKTNEN